MTITAEHDLAWWRERALAVEEECARRDGQVQRLKLLLKNMTLVAFDQKHEIARLQSVLQVYRVIRNGELSRRERWLGKIAYWRKRAKRVAERKRGSE
jgi:hypothetical protein